MSTEDIVFRLYCAFSSPGAEAKKKKRKKRARSLPASTVGRRWSPGLASLSSDGNSPFSHKVELRYASVSPPMMRPARLFPEIEPRLLGERDLLLKAVTQRDKELAEKDLEIELLKAQVEELKVRLDQAEKLPRHVVSPASPLSPPQTPFFTPGPFADDENHGVRGGSQRRAASPSLLLYGKGERRMRKLEL